MSTFRGFCRNRSTTTGLGARTQHIKKQAASQMVEDLIGNIYPLKSRAPFDASLVILFIMAATMICTWDENYGEKTGDITASFKKAITVIREGKVWCILNIY